MPTTSSAVRVKTGFSWTGRTAGWNSSDHLLLFEYSLRETETFAFADNPLNLLSDLLSLKLLFCGKLPPGISIITALTVHMKKRGKWKQKRKRKQKERQIKKANHFCLTGCCFFSPLYHFGISQQLPCDLVLSGTRLVCRIRASSLKLWHAWNLCYETRAESLKLKMQIFGSTLEGDELLHSWQAPRLLDWSSPNSWPAMFWNSYKGIDSALKNEKQWITRMSPTKFVGCS